MENQHFFDVSTTKCFSIFTKINGILGLMLLANENASIEQSIAHGALWAVSDFVKELEAVCELVNEQFCNKS